MKLLSCLNLIILFLTSCDPEGVHVGHVISRGTSKIRVIYHDINDCHEWLNGHSNSRAHSRLKLKFDNLRNDEVLLVAGNLDNDLVLTDTIVPSYKSYEVSMYLQDKYLPKVDIETAEAIDASIERFVSIILSVVFSIVIFILTYKLCRFINLKLKCLYQKFKILNEIEERLNAIKDNSWDRNKLVMRLKNQGYDSSMIKDVLDELEKDIENGNN